MRRTILVSLLLVATMALAGASVVGAAQLPAKQDYQAQLYSLQTDAPQDDATLQERYLAAVKDAEIAEPSEISRELVAVTENNDRLIWSGDPGSKRLLVATWTGWAGYSEQVGQATTAGVETWVTVVPEVQDFCKAGGFEDKTLRLEQLIGLPPHNGKKWFVELWVSPSDLFRPSADPDITDHEAEVSFPDSSFVSVSQQYKDWYNDLNSKSYGEDGYPWTRLGYTYDWGNPDGEIGLSEFVIKKGAPIEVKSVVETLSYCQ